MRIIVSILLSLIILSVAFQSSLTRGLISWQEETIVANNNWGNLSPAALECAVNCFVHKKIADNHNPNLPGLGSELEKKTQLFNPEETSKEIFLDAPVNDLVMFHYTSKTGLDFLNQIFHPPRVS